METLIAICGLRCDTCPIHAATMEKDPARRQKMRLEIARLCSERYGMRLSPGEVTDCDGCSLPGGRIFAGCARCGIRTCAIDRSPAGCAFCPGYECEKLLHHFETYPAARTTLELIRKTAGRQPPAPANPA